MRKSVLAVLCLASAALAWAANEKDDVSRLLQHTVGRVLTVVRDTRFSRQEKKNKVIEAVTPVFDFDLMAKLTLGRTYWPKFNEMQRKTFTEFFVQQLQSSYLDKVELVSDEKVVYGEPVENGGKIQVMTTILSKEEPIKLLYKFYKRKDEWKVYDVEIQDVSLVKSYSLQYQQILQQGTAEDLLAKMKEKIKQLEKESQKAANKEKR